MGETSGSIEVGDMERKPRTNRRRYSAAIAEPNRPARPRPRLAPVSIETVAPMPVRSASAASPLVDLQPDRYALRDLHPVAGGVLGGQQRELRVGAGADRYRRRP